MEESTKIKKQAQVASCVVLGFTRMKRGVPRRCAKDVQQDGIKTKKGNLSAKLVKAPSIKMKKVRMRV
jgi:hypothetical protein